MEVTITAAIDAQHVTGSFDIAQGDGGPPLVATLRSSVLHAWFICEPRVRLLRAVRKTPGVAPSNRRTFCAIIRLALVACAAMLGCKSNTIGGNQASNEGNDGEIGPSGGTVSLSDGTEVRIAARALTTKPPSRSASPNRPISTRSTQYTEVGEVYAFEPHGLQFQTPVVIDAAYRSNAPTGSLLVLAAEQSGHWAPVANAVFSGKVGEVSATSFSFYTVVSTVTAPDSGPSCAGAGADNSAPTGTFTNGVGTIPGSTSYLAHRIQSIFPPSSTGMPFLGSRRPVHSWSLPDADHLFARVRVLRKRGGEDRRSRCGTLVVDAAPITAQSYQTSEVVAYARSPSPTPARLQGRAAAARGAGAREDAPPAGRRL